MRSKKFSLNWQDFLKGLLIACGSSAAMIVQQSLDSGSLEFNAKAIGMAAIGGGITYLIKNYFTDNKIGLHPEKPNLN